MSAYAMPGSLFALPTSKCPSAADAGTINVHQQTNVASGSGSGATTAYPTSPKSTIGPLHEQIDQIEQQPTSPEPGIDLGRRSLDGSRCRDIIIAVKSASVDPVGLIQSIARGGGGGAPSRMQRRQSSSRRRIGGSSSKGGRSRVVAPIPAANDAKTVTAPPSSSSPSSSSPASPTTHNSTTSESPSSPSHDDAIQFVLSINFNGRTYTATRTLPRLVELRNDLLREVRERGVMTGLVNGRRRDARRRQRSSKGPHYVEQRGTDDALYSSSSSSSDTEGSDCEEAADFSGSFDFDDDDETDVYAVIDVSQIPELPIGEDGASSSFAGRGFTRLQAILRSYCPAIEGWLNNVANMVPPSTSPSLTDFLWEPLSANTSTFGEDCNLSGVDLGGGGADGTSSSDEVSGEVANDAQGGRHHAKPPRSGSPRSGTGMSNKVSSSSSSSLSPSGRKTSSSRSICTMESINEDE